MDLNQFINGENLKQICDIVIDQNTVGLKRNYKNKNIIFCKTDFIETVFNEVKNNKDTYTLITHQSDYEINERIFNYKPKNIINWYAQNVNYKHENLIPIPIGLENHFGPSKGSSIDIKVLENYKIQDSYAKNNLLYTNFNVNNHQDRYNWQNQINSLNLNIINKKKSFSDYTDDLKNSYFCASPRGNGIDCHRTWESLYYDCIPIVPRHFIYDSFNAPIIQIEKETDLTLDLLQDAKNKYFNENFQFDKKFLTLQYWKNVINNTIKNNLSYNN